MYVLEFVIVTVSPLFPMFTLLFIKLELVLIFPFTSSAWPGVVVPIPTFPVLSTLMRSEPDVSKPSTLDVPKFI